MNLPLKSMAFPEQGFLPIPACIHTQKKNARIVSFTALRVKKNGHPGKHHWYSCSN